MSQTEMNCNSESSLDDYYRFSIRRWIWWFISVPEFTYSQGIRYGCKSKLFWSAVSQKWIWTVNLTVGLKSQSPRDYHDYNTNTNTGSISGTCSSRAKALRAQAFYHVRFRELSKKFNSKVAVISADRAEKKTLSLEVVE